MATCPNCLERFDDGVQACPNDGEALLDDAAFAAADRDLAPGDTVGEYEVTGKLGEGGFGAVFAAEQPVIGKKVAIKVLKRQFSANPRSAARFIAEARAVNQIGHRYIIDIFSFGQLADGRHYFVMSLLDGEPLDALVRRRGGRLEVAEAVPILAMIAEAVDAAHAAGIAHRDLKPDNVFVCSDGTIKLLDFGVAKLSHSESAPATRTGAAMGTAAYMSPEQARGRDVDHRTDVYAFGAMTFHLLTGTLPFSSDDAMDLLMKQIYEPPPRPSERLETLPSEVDEPIGAMLKKHADQRPQTMADAINGLRRALGEDVPEPAPLPRSEVGQTLPETAGVETAPGLTVSGIAAESVPSTELDSPRSSRPIIAAVALLGVAGVVALVAVRGLGSSDADPPVESPAMAATSAPDAAAALAPDAAPPVAVDAAPVAVEVRFAKAPAGAEVFAADGTRLGTAPGPVSVPFSRRPVELTLRRRRDVDRVVTVRADAASEVEAAMTRERRAPRTPPEPGGLTLEKLERLEREKANQ